MKQAQARMDSQIDKRRLSPAVITVIALLVIAGISVYIRIALPYDQVFRDGWVAFKGVDPYYHMRLVDNYLHHFPHHISFDPYYYYPSGMSLPSAFLFDWLIAAVALIAGLGSPTQHTIDLIGAYFPAVLGTLTIIPVYFIGKELFNRWAGVLSAVVVVILPGEFLNRSLLGFTDHHVAEALFTTTTILFLILAVKRAREREISFGHLINRNWQIIAKPLMYTLLAGVFLGIYLLAWGGALLFVFIIFAYLIIQFLVDHLRGKSTEYLCITSTLSFLIATLMLFPFLGKGLEGTLYRISLLIAILMPPALSGISRVMANKAMKPAYYPLALAGLAGIGLAAFYAINPSLLRSMLGYFSVFRPGVTLLTVMEARPLSLEIAWLNFTTTFFVSFISLGLLLYAAIKEKSADKTLFLVWSLVMLVAVLSQRRFSYYYAINAALLTGYFCWRLLDFAGIKELLARPEDVVEVARKTKKEARKKKKARAEIVGKKLLQPSITWMRVIVAGVAIFFLVFFFNTGKAEALAKSSPLITPGWHSSLLWLKDNTPEPCGDADFYYELYELPPPGENYKYPETAYGVLSWWDYGDWIVRIGRRMPNCARGPSETAANLIAPFLIAQDEDSANEIMDKLGSKYVISDNQMPIGKFYAFVIFVGKSQNEFFETYYQPAEGDELKPIDLFYPAYYRSMVVRLYNFDGRAVVPQETFVISYQEKISKEGARYKEITNSWSLPSYEDAEAYISSQESGNYRIVSPNPLATPVPLEELHHYKLIHQSHTITMVVGEGLPEIKIFEYVGS